MSSVPGRGEAYKGIQCTYGDASKPCVGMRNPISLQRESWAVFPGKMIRSCKNLGKLTLFNSLNIFNFHRVVWNLSFSSKLSQSIFSLCWVRESELPWVHVLLRTLCCWAQPNRRNWDEPQWFFSIKGRLMTPYQNHQIALIVPRPVKFPIRSYGVLTLLIRVTDQVKAAKSMVFLPSDSWSLTKK